MHITSYAAGSDVFFPDAPGVLRRKVALCASHGIRLRTPLDTDIDLSLPDAGAHIYRANRRIMLECDIAVANLSPFRGPLADDGTSFEVGFFDAMRRPVFAYSNAAGTLADRTRAFLQSHPDPASFTVEDFGLPVNLMMSCAVLDRGGLPMFIPTEADLPHDDLTVFGRLVEAVAERCAPIARLRRDAYDRTERPQAVDAALRQPRAELDGATPLEAAIHDPGAHSALLAMVAASALQAGTVA